MTTPPGPLPGPAEKPTVYRGTGAVFGGALVLLFCLGGGIDLLIEEGTVDLPGVSVMFLVAALAFAYGVYPAALSGPHALVVRNPLRTLTIPWGVVTKLSAQLSFIAFTTTQRYTVWAVPVSIRERRRAERSRMRDLARQSRVGGDQRKRRGASAFSFGATQPTSPTSDFDRLSYADQALSEMNARREAWCHSAGIDPETDPTSTEVPGTTWNVLPIALIAGCLVFVIVAFIVH